MTRVQQERFVDINEYNRLKDSYILTPDKLETAKSDMSILHPLPRVNEISVKIDKDPRACYFKQVDNGKLMRMALILKLLKEAEVLENENLKGENDYITDGFKCENPSCITSTEQELDHIFKKVNNDLCRCVYCEKDGVK
jgi:aspartate carbamoyltransferase catalytic subunit